MADFTWLDYIVFLIFFIAVIMGIARGILRELVSLVIIIFALLVAIRFTMPLTYFLYYTKGSRDVIAFIAHFISWGDWNTYLILFTLNLSLVLLFVGAMSIAEAVNSYMFPNVFMSSTLSLLYRVTGAVVGFMRGYVFSVILVLVLSVTPLSKDPAWTQSVLIPKLSDSVKKLGEKIAPGGYGKFSDVGEYRRKSS